MSSPDLTSLCPNSSTNCGFLRLNCLLLRARARLWARESLRHPKEGSSVYMKLMVAMMSVRTVQAEVHVSWWQLVKEVQMGVLVSKRPEGVQKQSLGARKGQFSCSSSSPWQKPPSQAPSSPCRQKWKFSIPTRLTSAFSIGFRSRSALSFSTRACCILENITTIILIRNQSQPSTHTPAYRNQRRPVLISSSCFPPCWPCRVRLTALTFRIEKDRPNPASPTGSGSSTKLPLLPDLYCATGTGTLEYLSRSREPTRASSRLTNYSSVLSSSERRWVSFSFWRRATWRESRATLSTLCLYSPSCLSRLAIFCANWLSTRKLARACSISSFLNLSLSRLGVMKPMFSLLACTIAISRLASAISLKMLVCSDLTESTASWSSSTLAGFISSSMRWKSSLILILRSTVLMRLSSWREQAASARSCRMWACMPSSCASQRSTRRQTSVKLSLKSASRCSTAALLAVQSSRRTSVVSISARRARSWQLQCVICASASARLALRRCSRASTRAGSMLEASWKSRMPFSTLFSVFQRQVRTSSSLIFSSMRALKSLRRQLSLVSSSRMRSPRSNVASSTRCATSIADLLLSPRTSSTCSCSAPVFSPSCIVSSPSTPVIRLSSRFCPPSSIDSPSLSWFSFRENSPAFMRSFPSSVPSGSDSSRLLRSLMMLGSECTPALMRAMVSVSCASPTLPSTSRCSLRREESCALSWQRASWSSLASLAMVYSSSSWCSAEWSSSWCASGSSCWLGSSCSSSSCSWSQARIILLIGRR